MRLKKGSKIEVFQSDGIWRPAQILHGNGRTYCVQFDSESQQIRKINRKLIRPSPEIKQKLINWKIGDLCEVLIHGAWRHAKVTAVAFGNEFIFVNIIGHYSRLISVRRNNVRLRHIWQDNKWTVIKKDSESKEETKKRKLDDCDFKKYAKKPRIEIKGEKNVNNNSCENESINSLTDSSTTSGRLRNYAQFEWAHGDAMSSSNKTHFEKEIFTNELELNAYFETMRVFYEKGFISWEQEAILSNLRVFLNISCDEHRSVLTSMKPSR
ncbi:hypothetical protein LUZ60_016939 [Juncus effusus]|nr:hypothetical protein LUZ60_016939 [Juncus effusus]